MKADFISLEAQFEKLDQDYKKMIADIKDGARRLGYFAKRIDFHDIPFCETANWHEKFTVPAIERRERLNEKLSIEELLEESEDQLLEAFAYFLCLTPEQQQRTAQQFKDGLERVQKLREANRERARQMLAKQGVRYG